MREGAKTGERVAEWAERIWGVMRAASCKVVGEGMVTVCGGPEIEGNEPPLRACGRTGAGVKEDWTERACVNQVEVGSEAGRRSGGEGKAVDQEKKRI